MKKKKGRIKVIAERNFSLQAPASL